MTRRMGLRWTAAAAALALAGGTFWALHGGQRSGRATTATTVATSTATVVRTTVSTTDQVNGTLGYTDPRTITNQLPAGVVTATAEPGSFIARGAAVYELDGAPVRLLYGARPAWRAFTAGMADGADVAQLNANLIALGYGAQPISGTRFTWATGAAIRAWQRQLGVPQTGTLPLGSVVFEPGQIRIAQITTAVGSTVDPGQGVLSATGTAPSILIALDPVLLGSVRPGDAVNVTLPDQSTAVGHIATVAHAAVAQQGGQGGQNTGQSAPAATVAVTAQLDQPAVAGAFDQAPVTVSIIVQSHQNVLAVPVTALLAQPGGTYAVDLMSAAGDHRTPVVLGLTDDSAGLVEVSGPGIAAGAKVQVPAV